MTSRQLKLLTASTAFVAVAGISSAANASVMIHTSNTTAPLYTSTTTGINVSGTATVHTTGSAAILISGTGAMPINVSTSATIRSNDSVGTIATEANTGITGITVNNSGTILNTGTGAAINGTATQAGGVLAIPLTVRNTGTISGTVDAGSNALNYSGGNGFVQNGNLTSTNATGTDAVSLTGGIMRGNINLGAGTNSLTVSSSVLSGNYTGSTAVDHILVKDNSTVNGNIALDTGADTLTVNGSRINGNISAGATDGAAVTLTNAIVSGTINLGGTGDTDSLTIDGTNTFTTLGNISNVETVAINTNTVLNHTLSDVNSLTVQANKTLTVNKAFGTAAFANNGTTNINDSTAVTGGLTNTGTVNIAAGKTLQAATYTGTAGTLGIGISDTTAAGKLALSGGSVGATSVTINMGANSGYIANGTSYTIATGTGTAVTSTLLTSRTGVYRYALQTVTNSVVLNVTRVSNTSVVTGSDNKAAGAAIEKLGTASTGTLKTIQTVIGQQTTAQGVEDVIESLTPSIDGVGAASIGVTVDTGNQISNRLASVRSTSGVATGDPMASKHMWLQGFGSTVSQDDRSGNSGYDANSGGVSVGVDTDTLFEGVTTGVAFSYGRSTVDSNASSNASADIDTYIGTIYGSRVFDNGVFFNGQIGGGYNKYDMERTIIGVGKSKGDTDGFQGTAKVEAGRDFAVNNFTLTPLASLQYTYLDMDSYTESGAGGASLRVDPEALSTWDAGFGGQVAYAVPLSDGGTLKPSAHAKYIYRMGDDSMGTTSSFTGGGAAFNTAGVKADRSSVNLGAGLVLTTIGGTDLSLNYDADIRSNLTGHTGQVKARWAF